MRNDVKRALAATLLNAAGDLVDSWPDVVRDSPWKDELANVSAKDAAEQFGLWLGRLPSEAWDGRLIDPYRRSER